MTAQRLEHLHHWIKYLLLVVVVAWLGLFALYLYQGGWERLQNSRTMARFFPASYFPGPQVAIISGHRGFDAGAVCEDGLMEAAINEAIATRVVKRLNDEGVAAQLLDEYDPRLEGLHARALLSIHADSCVGRSGFKIASAEQTSIPQLDASLVACLRQSYEQATGLVFQASAITADMTQYHAFQRIADDTPGAIIETGYLGGDRELLQDEPEKLAEAITSGIICFLDQSTE